MNHQSPVLILNDVINRDLAPTSLSPKPSTLMHASWGASTAFAKTRYRHLPLPPDHDLCAAATRTLTVFAAPHKVLELDAAAKKLLQATCTLCNIKASLIWGGRLRLRCQMGCGSMESWCPSRAALRLRCVRRPDRPGHRRGQSSVVTSTGAHPQGERTPRPLGAYARCLGC